VVVNGWQYLYVGPYAEWLVPDNKRSRAFGSSEVRDRLRDVLAWNFGVRGKLRGLRYGVGVGKQAKKRASLCRHCFVPKVERPGAPDRLLFAFGAAPVMDVLDLGAVDRAAEVAWFGEAFAEELRALAEYFGAAPTLHWGLVHWFDDYG
jgi:hypothetical protein